MVLRVIGMPAWAAGAAMLFSTTGAAAACERFVEIGNDQVRHHIKALKSADADELDQIDILETLMCAEKPSVRDLAARTALASPNPSIRAAMLLDVLAQKQGVTVELIEEEEMPNDVRDYVKEKIAFRYAIRYADRDESCISLSSDKECGDDSLDITGTKVELYYFNRYGASPPNGLGSFFLNETGDLVGYFKPLKESLKVPAKIDLL